MPHKVPLSVNEIKEEILWNDRYIKIGGKTVFCIKDILNAHDNFLSFQDLKDTFDVRCSFLITVVFLQRFLKLEKCYLTWQSGTHRLTNGDKKLHYKPLEMFQQNMLDYCLLRNISPSIN